MTRKLTRAEREAIVFDHLKGKSTPGYNVIETKTGHYRVTPVKIEIDSDSDDEQHADDRCSASPGGKADDQHEVADRHTVSEKENVLELLNLIRHNLQDSAHCVPDGSSTNTVSSTPTRSYRRRRLVF